MNAPALLPLEAAPRHGSHLHWLESEAIYILREVAGECERPVLFFSGGKDSIIRATGALILIDPATNRTVAAGMIA
jgi:3'-phosphoadenosine 5'-phosphosulfate sulfotransferase (PAPS reductase)/FAD synthetase